MINKNIFRTACLKKLKKKVGCTSYRRDKEILASLVSMIKKKKAQRIMLYVPMKMEVNLFPLISQLRKAQKLVYVPFMEGDSFSLVKYRLPLSKKKFGVYEPRLSRQYRKKSIDIAIIPMIGIDSTFRRIGFGKGMYDRFFEKYHHEIKYKVFVARKLCYSPTIVSNHYDIMADSVVVGKV